MRKDHKLEDIQRAKANLAESFEGLSDAVEVSKERFLKHSVMNDLLVSEVVDSFTKTLVEHEKSYIGPINSAKNYWNQQIDTATLALKSHVELLIKALETHKSLCDAYIKQ